MQYYYAFCDTNSWVISWATSDSPEPVTPPDGLTTYPLSNKPGRPPYKGARLAILSGNPVWLDTRTVAAARAVKRVELVNAWNAACSQGVTLGAKVAPTDATAWTRYLALARMAEDADWIDVPIMMVDGTFEIVTKAKAGLLWTALKGLERTLLTKLRDKITLVQAATTVAEVDSITWE